MEYYVFNENNCRQKVTDEQLDTAFLQKDELPVHIIAGMGVAKAVKYLPRLKEALYYEKRRSRHEAIYSIFGIEDKEVISILKQKESSLTVEELNTDGSEKAFLQALIIRLEGGSSAVTTAFFDPCVNALVKYRIMFMYYSHFTMVLEDLHFLIDALEAFSRREEGWIQALNKDDYTDAVIQGVEAVSKAMESYNLLEHLSCDYYSKLAVTGKKLLEMKLDSIVKETIADFSKGLPPSYAYSMLEPIMNGKARGDVKRELNKSLAILAMKSEKKD